MPTATVTSKGQITIPAAVRKDLDVRAGDRVEFIPIEPGIYQFIPVSHPVGEIKGLLGRNVDVVSAARMAQDLAAQGEDKA